MLLYLLVLHFIADFLLQSREMGKKKSVEFKVLMQHLNIQGAVFFVGLLPFVGFKTALEFSGMNLLFHGIIDWNIWRAYKLSAHIRIKNQLSKWPYNQRAGDEDSPVYKVHYQTRVDNWKYWEDHWFYSTIGLDQLLHTATIVVLWSWLCP